MSDRRQEWYHTMVRGLASQNWETSMSEKGYCAYRGLTGKKCPVGYLIEDSVAAQFEGFTVGEIDSCYSLDLLGLGPISDQERIFLVVVQRTHDAFTSRRYDLRDNFLKLKDRFNFSWPENVPIE